MGGSSSCLDSRLLLAARSRRHWFRSRPRSQRLLSGGGARPSRVAQRQVELARRRRGAGAGQLGNERRGHSEEQDHQPNRGEARPDRTPHERAEAGEPRPRGGGEWVGLWFSPHGAPPTSPEGCRGLEVRGRLAERLQADRDPVKLLAILSASRAIRQVSLHPIAFFLRPHAACQEGDVPTPAAAAFEWRVHVHVSPRSSERFRFIRRSFSKPWCSRLFTVPTEQPSAAAISGSDASSKKRRSRTV